MFTVYDRKKGRFRVGKLEDVKDRGMDWIDCLSPTEQEIKKIASILKLSQKHLIHLMKSDARAQAYDDKEYSLLAFSIPYQEDGVVKFAPFIVFLLKNNTLITVRTHDLAIVATVADQLRTNPESMSSPIDFIHRLIEVMLQKYETMLTGMDDDSEKIEDRVMTGILTDDVSKIFAMRKEVIVLQRSLLPLREILATIRKGYLEGIPPKDRVRFHFLFNDAIKLYDQADIIRETLRSVLEMRLIAQSNRLNVTVKKLTAWASLFLLPTLIASIYGMNFDTSSMFNMPELTWKFGYLFSIGLMAASTLGLYLYFKKADWL